MDLTDGTTAVRAARLYAEAETKREVVELRFTKKFSEKKGVFVTISKYPSGDLRGCIGYPEPKFPLKDALKRSAVSACHDPRFNDLTNEEVATCTFEVTVLSVPEEIMYATPTELMSKIVIGRDGLILKYKGRRGLLLPQVPVEHGWGTEEYLRHLAMKAGQGPDDWKDPEAVIESFRGEIFSEISPEGEVKRK
ncbi:MAG: TIGR00296 family protein [Methanomassiliicoccaceae archaeon]|nr:TIGR00296 family protein [Methanomassiliicoccaceae archaeon]